MSFIRRLFGLDFPDPQVGQVWRSRHSGRAFRIESVKRSDSGRGWHLSLQYECESESSPTGYAPIPIPQACYCTPGMWRRMLRDEGRTLEPKWPRH